tara:strand:+ start:282 stop:521 length:240 start_codon:yes stop_codon:yes gene_type:complete
MRKAPWSKQKTHQENIEAWFKTNPSKLDCEIMGEESFILYLKKQLKECVSDEKRIFLLDNLSKSKTKLADLKKQKKGVK